jgi:hypothetical protein
MIRAILLIPALVLSQVGYTCEYTEDYLDLKVKYAKTAELAYISCVAVMESANYWYQNSQCLEANDGKNISGGCGVVVGNKKKTYKNLSAGPEVCIGHSAESELYEQAFQNTVRQLKVTKCKET